MFFAYNSRKIREIFRLSWPLIFSSLFFLSWLFHAAQTTLTDPDTYLHVTIGQRILELQSIPIADPFSHTMLGAPWIAHEWLADIILALTYQHLGWYGLHALTIAAAALTLAYILRFQLDRKAPPIYAIFFTSLAALSLLNHLLARPHVLTWPLVVIWFGGLLTANEKSQTPSWWLILLLVLWANFHGSYILALAILPLLAIDTLLNSPKPERWRLAKSWTLFFFIAVLASLITPYGWHSLEFSYNLLNQPEISKIDEWAPANFRHVNALEIWIGILLSLGCLGLLKLPALRLIITLSLLYEALSHVRYVSIFGMLIPLLIAMPFQRQYLVFSAKRPHNRNCIDVFFERLAIPATHRMAVGTAVLLITCSYYISNAVQPQPSKKYTPDAAIRTAKTAGLANKPVFNDYPFGGFLIAQGIPVFIDGRADMYGPEFFKSYFNAIDRNRLSQFLGFLSDHNVEWTLLPPNNYLVDYLSEQSDWKIIHADEQGVVHQRIH